MDVRTMRDGDRCGLSGGGYPAPAIEREDGKLWFVRLSDDLKSVRREEISAQEAQSWVDAEAA